MNSAAGFWGVAAIILLSALKVVRSRDLVHAVLWLAVTLLGTAALYAMFDQGFIAAVQVLTYVGGVVTLTLFGVMVTRRHDTAPAVAENEADERGFLAALALFAVLALALWRTPLPAAPLPAATTAQLAHALLDEYLLAFEAISVLLLAAVVGAVVIARRTDPEIRAAPEPVPLATAKEVEG